jgi:hypothetical protein
VTVASAIEPADNRHHASREAAGCRGCSRGRGRLRVGPAGEQRPGQEAESQRDMSRHAVNCKQVGPASPKSRGEGGRPYNREVRTRKGGTVVAALVCAFAPVSPSFIERWYATGLYPRIQHVLTPISNVIRLRCSMC